MGKKQLQTAHLTGSILCCLLTVFGIVTGVISLLSGSQSIWFIGDCVQILIYCLIAYYAFVGYKKPHGNLLKYIMLFYAAYILFTVRALVPVGNTALIVLYAAQIGMLCYIAGRLVKAKENLILMILATACFAADLVIECILGIVNIGVVGFLVIWLDICVAYFLRYKEHREAGLSDAPKK